MKIMMRMLYLIIELQTIFAHVVRIYKTLHVRYLLLKKLLCY